MFRKYFISLARSCCIYYIHSDSYLLEKSVKYIKIEAVSKGIGSARIPRNQALRIYLVPNRKKIFNEAMRRTDLTPVGYEHLLLN